MGSPPPAFGENTSKGRKDNVLFVTGSEDFVFIAGVKKKYREMQHTRLKILQRRGHVCNIQKWKECNRIALRYINAGVSPAERAAYV